jgi:competence protein CoiA
MPLRAEIRGKSILAFELNPTDWLALKRQLQSNRSWSSLPCCSAQAVAKTSKLGTQFFAHYAKSECDTVGETEAHLLAKRAVYEGCLDAGWEALMELANPDGTWRADVLASRDGTKVAFEIQWSRQSAARTLERQRGFSQRDVRCFWLFRRLPFATPTPLVPAFALREESGVVPPSVILTRWAIW